MEYPGYILSNRLPSVKSIHAFTDELINYLFPVTDEPEMFMEHHEGELYKLQTHLKELLCSVNYSNKLNIDDICDKFFAGLSAVKDKLIQDAQLILDLLLEDRFPCIWVPSWENRDLRQLLWHRHRMVQARTRMMNQLQAVALNEGLRYKKRLWREAGRKQLEAFRLAPWASRRRPGRLLHATSQPVAGKNPRSR